MLIKCAENILLLGAGFTKNFGGLLADEMWAEIFNNEKVQAKSKIKKLMLNDFDYESVYYSILEGFEDKNGLFGEIDTYVTFSVEEKYAIKVATKSAYDYIDKILMWHIIRFGPEYFDHKPKWVGVVYALLMNFGITNNKSFIFTLNQDLFIERFYQNPSKDYPNKNNIPELSIPGIDKSPEWFMNLDALRDKSSERLHNGEKDIQTCEEKEQFYRLKEDDNYTLPDKAEFDSKKNNLLEKGNFFLMKLHGSYNWKSSDGLDAMVIGRGKTEQMMKEPLLCYYFEIFKAVLSQGKRRLLVIGYGFGDEHINGVISKAIRDDELKLYILSPISPEKLKYVLCEGPKKSENTINIWNGISGYFQCVEDTLLKDFNGNQVVKEHFYDVFFGRNNMV
jgi:hypothetical protein